jgi:hypothetical protein
MVIVEAPSDPELEARFFALIRLQRGRHRKRTAA